MPVMNLLKLNIRNYAHNHFSDFSFMDIISLCVGCSATHSVSNCLPVKRDRNSVAVNPALEKDLSDEADVAGIQRYFDAILHSKGN